jgi:TatD DNase family protein
MPYRGKRNESAYIVNIAEKLAELKNTTVEKVANITTENSVKIYGV